MPDQPKWDIAVSALRLLPSRLRKSLVSDPDFREEHALGSDAIVTFGDSVIFRRSELLRKARKLIGRDGSDALNDVKDGTWTLIGRRGTVQLEIQQGDDRLILPDLSIVAEDPQVRLKGLAEASAVVNLPEESYRQWHELLTTREPTDDEFGVLNEDLQDTPVRMASRITESLGSGTTDIASLVPRSLRYYERLVGRCAHATIAEFVEVEIRRHVNQLVRWRRFEGLQLSLLLASHSSIVKEIPVSLLAPGDMQRLLEWARHSGDLLSQLGAFELGIAHAGNDPAITQTLGEIAMRFAGDEAGVWESRFGLLSGLFVLVDGELGHAGALEGKPPYWRRLAALAHASLIERSVIATVEDWASLSKWALQARAQPFYLQALNDLRLEPRWLPEFAAANQLKAEMVGRAANVAHLHEARLSPAVRSITLGQDENSLHKRVPLPHAFFPGPLEGATAPLSDMPRQISEHITESLGSDILQPKSFLVLVNCALMFRLDVSYSELAARGIRAANYHLSVKGDGQQTHVLLTGLAHVAAVTRSTVLADELVRLVRRCRIESVISDCDAFHIGLIAAAARSDEVEWCEFVGRWMNELAFGCSNTNEAAALHSHLSLLCRLKPALWATCGRGEAALRAFASR